MFDLREKRVLVAGGTGLIGTHLVELLIAKGAEVKIASLDDESRAHPGARWFQRADMMDFQSCLDACRQADYVFNLMGFKGSPSAVRAYPADYFEKNLIPALNLLRAAYQQNVGGYLYTSSYGVYAPAEVMKESDVWVTFPSPNDRFAGWAKRMGELQVEAYVQQYGLEISIVRPANTYGPHDNFSFKNAMVIPSLIRRVAEGENPLLVWGDGSQIRDFVHAQDVARGMVLVAEQGIRLPVNLGSGVGISIKELVELIVDSMEAVALDGHTSRPEVVWDVSKPPGDAKRVLDISRARSVGYSPEVSLKDGIRQTMEWHLKNRS